eukprot:2340211-Rhodomonas_salina.1
MAKMPMLETTVMQKSKRFSEDLKNRQIAPATYLGRYPQAKSHTRNDLTNLGRYIQPYFLYTLCTRSVAEARQPILCCRTRVSAPTSGVEGLGSR